MEDTTPYTRVPRYPWFGKKPFYGWIIVIVGAVTQFIQGVYTQGLTSYFDVFKAEFGWNSAQLSGPRSVTQIQGVITGPLEGWLVDRFGPRKVVFSGVILSSLGYVLFGLINNYPMYYIVTIILTIGIELQGLLIMSVTVNNWFNQRRTIAQSIMGLGYSIAGVIGVPALVLLMGNYGWREASFFFAGFILIAGIPFALLLRDTPESIGEIPDGRKKHQEKTPDKTTVYQGYDFTLKQAIRTRSFWILALGSSVGNLGILAAQLHLFLHLMEGAAGMEKPMAAAVWMVSSFSNIPSRLIGGYFGDKLPKNIMLGVAMIMMAVSIYILAIADSAPMAFSYAVIFGLGWGIRTPILNAVQGEYFGRKSQGIIRGWINSIGLPIMIAAPVVVGYMKDVQGTYVNAFTIMSLVMLVGGIMVFFATRPSAPAAVYTDN